MSLMISILTVEVFLKLFPSMSSHCLVSSLASAMSFKDPLYEHLLKSPAEFQGPLI